MGLAGRVRVEMHLVDTVGREEVELIAQALTLPEMVDSGEAEGILQRAAVTVALEALAQAEAMQTTPQKGVSAG